MQNKQSEQFERLWRAHQSELSSLASRLSEQKDDAEDVEGEALTAMWAAFDTYDPSLNFIAWATGYIKTCAKAVGRKNAQFKRSNGLSLDSLMQDEYETI